MPILILSFYDELLNYLSFFVASIGFPRLKETLGPLITCSMMLASVLLALAPLLLSVTAYLQSGKQFKVISG